MAEMDGSFDVIEELTNMRRAIQISCPNKAGPNMKGLHRGQF